MSKKVLTIDDSKTVRMIVGKFFNGFDVEIIEAENGAVGLTKANETKPDLIFLDYNMPVMDGYHTLSALKTDPNLRSIPVIMLTTEAVKETVVKLIKLGLKDYIAKPFLRDSLLQKANGVLQLFEGEYPPSQAEMEQRSREKAAGQTAAAGSSTVQARFLEARGDVRVLAFPEAEDPQLRTFRGALDKEIPDEIVAAHKAGSSRLVIRLGSACADGTMVRKLIALLGQVQKLGLACRLVPSSAKVRGVLNQFAETAEVPAHDSLDLALASFS